MNKKEAGGIPVKLAKPAQRALSGEGITTLKQLTKLSEEEISSLHGIGQNALQQIKKSLSENGLSLRNTKRR